VVRRSAEASSSTCNSSRRMTRSKAPRRLPGEVLDQEHRQAPGLLHASSALWSDTGAVSMSVRFKNLREDRAQHVSAQLLARSTTPSTASPRRSTRTSGSQPSTPPASAISQPRRPPRRPVGRQSPRGPRTGATRATRTTTEGARSHAKRRRTTRGPRARGGTGRRCGDDARADGKEAAKRTRVSVRTIRRVYMPYHRPRSQIILMLHRGLQHGEDLQQRRVRRRPARSIGSTSSRRMTCALIARSSHSPSCRGAHRRPGLEVAPLNGHRSHWPPQWHGPEITGSC
jgi:hypothetical protein